MKNILKLSCADKAFGNLQNIIYGYISGDFPARYIQTPQADFQFTLAMKV